jgi:hypothetical protein
MIKISRYALARLKLFVAIGFATETKDLSQMARLRRYDHISWLVILWIDQIPTLPKRRVNHPLD